MSDVLAADVVALACGFVRCFVFASLLTCCLEFLGLTFLSLSNKASVFAPHFVAEECFECKGNVGWRIVEDDVEVFVKTS